MANNNYIVGKAFKSFLVAAILTGLAEQLRVFADGIIVSNLIETDALSAVNLSYPLTLFFYALVTTVIAGAGIQGAIEIGRQDHRKVSEYFSSSFLVTMPVILVLVGLCYLFFPQLISLLADSEEVKLYGLTATYTKISLLTFILLVPNYLLRTFICIDGKPKLVTQSIVASLILNIILDLLFIGVFQMGIAGAAWATLISDFAGTLVFIPHLASKQSSFRLVKPRDTRALVVAGLKQGAPISTGNILLALLVFVLNQLVLAFQGPTGAYILAIMIQIIVLGGSLIEGIADLNNSVGGVLLGEQDYSGFRFLIHRSCKTVLVFGLAMALLTLCWPQGIMRIFGEDGSMADAGICITSLRIFGLFIIPYLIFFFNTKVHILVEQEMLAVISLASLFTLMIGVPGLFGVFVAGYFWWSFPILATFLLLFQAVAAMVIQRKNPDLTKIQLLPNMANPGIKYTIPSSPSAQEDALQQLQIELGKWGLDPTKTERAMEICKVIVQDIVGRNSGRRRGFFEIRATEETRTIRIKEAGRPIDHKFPNVNYKHMFGLNVYSLKV